MMTGTAVSCHTVFYEGYSVIGFYILIRLSHLNPFLTLILVIVLEKL